MTLNQRINDDMKAALLERRRFEGDVLRNLRAAILNEEVASGKRDEGLSDDAIEKIIAREVKKRAESARMYRDNGRDELADNEDKEAEVLSGYLPEQVSDDELRAEARATIERLGVSGPAGMGQVIGVLKQKFGNSADGATLAGIVKEELSK